MTILLLLLVTVVMALLSVALLSYANQRQKREAVLMRLREGEERLAGTYVSRDAQIHNPLLRAVCHVLWRSGSEIEPGAVQRILLVLALLVPVILLALGLFAGLWAIGILLATGFAVLTRQAARRRARIIEQLPAFLESAMRVMSAGNTLEEAFSHAARESPEPLRTLFLSITRQVRLGAPIEAVLAEAADIHQLRDLKVMALASSINRKYGGSLRNVLKSLIQAIRARDSAQRELRALTAETRFSAFVLAVIPAVVTLFIYVQNRGYYQQILETLSGRLTLAAAVALQVVGVLVIYRMMRSTDEGDA
ncbi:MAG TPA: type II secretion system F family protein [Nevskiaceae bacterium]|nr:type II secretion system F family protein [Nevskiaceae bacterium]